MLYCNCQITYSCVSKNKSKTKLRLTEQVQQQQALVRNRTHDLQLHSKSLTTKPIC